ncbi:uncharacterized protein CLUP02_06212 [Colletotrichum lupini]|uniref:Uncharacterized protein n=1 Tax=Colletotrichum lupini TaxID=145971 RepID=A0A9Q8SNQ7_9PEZI|nr:uncharacterized protein CLUP02_06212 [Colletotrichum lupini]UQC80727.1 hypothetical protein CLUP02_06212 [Colletotrichum lupini]
MCLPHLVETSPLRKVEFPKLKKFTAFGWKRDLTALRATGRPSIDPTKWPARKTALTSESDRDDGRRWWAPGRGLPYCSCTAARTTRLSFRYRMQRPPTPTPDTPINLHLQTHISRSWFGRFALALVSKPRVTLATPGYLPALSLIRLV